MKKVRWLIPIVIISIILALMVACVVVMAVKGLGFSTGRYLEAKNGDAMIIIDDSPIVMSNKTERDIFKNIDIGDKILIIHGATEESYPGRTGAYAVFKLKSGTSNDLSQMVINSLIDLGWLESDVNKSAVPDDFAFELTWGCYGISSYDSRSGKLVKTTDATNPEDYITYYELTDSDKEYIYNLIIGLDVNSYPDIYDPHDSLASKPTMTLILTVRTANTEKTIRAKNIAISYASNNQKGQSFLDVCKTIQDLLMSTDEWKALPDYEVYYD